MVEPLSEAEIRARRHRLLDKAQWWREREAFARAEAEEHERRAAALTAELDTREAPLFAEVRT